MAKKKVIEGQTLSLQKVPPAPVVVESTCVEVPPAPALPGKTINWTERFNQRYAETKAKLAAQKELFTKATPPVDPNSLTSETPIEGKTVGEWATILADSSQEIPGWAIWAVREWNSRGKPTPKDRVLDQITKLREDAEEQVKFATLDREKAARTPAKADKLLKAAKKKSEKAAKLFEEADKIAKAHREAL